MIYLKLGGKKPQVAKAKRCFYQSFLNKEAEGLEYVAVEMAEDFPYHRFKAVTEENSESEEAEAAVSSDHKEEINAPDLPDKNGDNNELVFGTSGNNEVLIATSQNQPSPNIGATKTSVTAISLKSLDSLKSYKMLRGERILNIIVSVIIVKSKRLMKKYNLYKKQ